MCSASAGYGFLTFSNHTVAESVLTTYNGVPIPNTDLVFRLNWAAFGVGKITSEGVVCISSTARARSLLDVGHALVMEYRFTLLLPGDQLLLSSYCQLSCICAHKC